MAVPNRPLRFASAISDAHDAMTAIDGVLGPLTERLPDGADLVIVFTTAHHLDALGCIHQKVHRALEPRAEIGVSGRGVIGVGMELENTAGLSVLAAKAPGVTLEPFCLTPSDWGSIETPQDLRRAMDTKTSGAGSVRAVITMADPFSTPVQHLLPLMQDTWPGVPIIGGMASAADKPHENRLIIGERVLREGVVGVAIGGPIRVDCTVSQGCRPIGRPHVITKASGSVIQELGGCNPMVVIHDMIESLPEPDLWLIKHQGLMVGRVINEYKDRFGRGDFLVRQLLGVQEPSGHLAINDPSIRTGQTIQFHIHDRDTAEQDMKLLLEAQKLHGRPEGALLFSCNGRGTHLFANPHADANMVREALGDVPLAGFFASGEIGPIGQENFVHGHTASLAVLRHELAHPDPHEPTHQAGAMDLGALDPTHPPEHGW